MIEEILMSDCNSYSISNEYTYLIRHEKGKKRETDIDFDWFMFIDLSCVFQSHVWQIIGYFISKSYTYHYHSFINRYVCSRIIETKRRRRRRKLYHRLCETSSNIYIHAQTNVYRSMKSWNSTCGK